MWVKEVVESRGGVVGSRGGRGLRWGSRGEVVRI